MQIRVLDLYRSCLKLVDIFFKRLTMSFSYIKEVDNPLSLLDVDGIVPQKLISQHAERLSLPEDSC